MQLVRTPFLISSANNVNKFQRPRAVDEGVVQSHHGICEKDGFVVIFAGERVGAHKRPVDVRRYLSEESFRIALAQVTEDLGDLAFVWIFGAGYALICRAVPCWRRYCKTRHGCGSDQKNLQRGMHHGFWSVEERRQDAGLVEMEVLSLNRSYTCVRSRIERSFKMRWEEISFGIVGFYMLNYSAESAPLRCTL